MAQIDIIKTISNPRIPLKELWAADDSNESGVFKENAFDKKSDQVRSAKEKRGSDKPFVKINSVEIVDIDQLIIDETGLIPKIKIVFRDHTGALSGPNYPKNDPIVSVYIKSPNQNFKPIRCDFLITSIKTNQDAFLNAKNISSGADFIMTGELYVPKIYQHLSKSYTNMNSKDALKKLANDVDLGFADNEFIPNDKMTWLQTNKSSLSFIDHISKHAYKDDDSFFTSFIDKYYHLTFINIAEQLNPAHDSNFTYENQVNASHMEGSQKLAKDKDKRVDDVLNIVGLTNRSSHRGKPEYVINYSLMGDTGSILKNKGFKKKIFYYDTSLNGNDKFTSFYVNPIRIKGYDSTKQVGLEPEDSVLKESIIKKWMNIHYGNTHNEWNASVLINDHNNSELNKVKLKVETAGINFQVIRGVGIPVIIYSNTGEKLDRNNYRKDSAENAEPDVNIDTQTLVPDDILSGRYYVSGVKYIYDALDVNFPFKTEFQLARMNWLGEKNIVE